VNLAQAARAAAEGALLGLYRLDAYKGGADRAGTNGAAPPHDRQIEAITVLGRGREPALRAAVARGHILAEATNFARDLGNEPANVLTPSALAERACAMARPAGLEAEVLDRARMTELGMGALLAVARGSQEPPRLIVLRYRGGPAGEPGLALVGKGVAFARQSAA
jgi:leucyl aminopeptidase